MEVQAKSEEDNNRAWFADALIDSLLVNLEN